MSAHARGLLERGWAPHGLQTLLDFLQRHPIVPPGQRV